MSSPANDSTPTVSDESKQQSSTPSKEEAQAAPAPPFPEGGLRGWLTVAGG